MAVVALVMYIRRAIMQKVNISIRDGEYEYAPGDVFIFPADVEHMIHNPTNEEHEMIFVRVTA